MRRRGGMARSDDRRLAELTRALFTDTHEAPAPDAKSADARNRGRKKRPASDDDANDD